LLRDSDWASMDHSVELRTPQVDAWLLHEVQPVLAGFRRFPKKRLLAEAPLKPLDEDLILQEKTGFAIPVQEWLISMGLTDARDGMSRGWARHLIESFDLN
jgi:asparagine synthase (glutamine-hydrolysing)